MFCPGKSISYSLDESSHKLMYKSAGNQQGMQYPYIWHAKMEQSQRDQRWWALLALDVAVNLRILSSNNCQNLICIDRSVKWLEDVRGNELSVF